MFTSSGRVGGGGGGGWDQNILSEELWCLFVSLSSGNFEVGFVTVIREGLRRNAKELHT